MRDSSRRLRLAAAGVTLLLVSGAACAEDGHRLWLRYDPVEGPLRGDYAREATEIVRHSGGTTVAEAELERGLSGLLAKQIPIRQQVDRDGAVLFALASDPDLRTL